MRPGDVVLVLGTGGVSLFALQFAKIMGLRVIATTSSAEKVQRLLSFGAHGVVDYAREPDWDAAVRRLTDGRGVDRVIEVGGSTINRSVASCAHGGHIKPSWLSCGRGKGSHYYLA